MLAQEFLEDENIVGISWGAGKVRGGDRKDASRDLNFVLFGFLFFAGSAVAGGGEGAGLGEGCGADCEGAEGREEGGRPEGPRREGHC